MHLRAVRICSDCSDFSGQKTKEKYVGIVKAVIVKSVKGDIRNFWKYRLNTIQFYLNRRVVHVHGTSPFTVMFGRRMNPFVNFQESQVLNEEESHSKGKARMEFLTNVLFPRVTKETNLLRKQDKRRFDEYSRLNQFPINSLVMITNTSKRSKRRRTRTRTRTSKSTPQS